VICGPRTIQATTVIATREKSVRRRSGEEQPEWELIKEAGFTPMPNIVVKALMAEATKIGKLSIVLVGLAILQESIGWKNGRGDGRQLLGHVSLSRFEAITGLSRPTIVDALAEISHLPMFRRLPTEEHKWAGWQYGINFEWLSEEIEKAGGLSDLTSREAEVVNSVNHPSELPLLPGSKGSLPDPVNGVDPTKRLYKETMKETHQRRTSLTDRISENWTSVLRELQSQVTAPIFQAYLKGLTPHPSENGQLLLQSQTGFDAQWIAGRLHRVLLRAIQAVEPAVGPSQIMIRAPGGELFPLGLPPLDPGADIARPRVLITPGFCEKPMELAMGE
jgi:hypothetical protein